MGSGGSSTIASCPARDTRVSVDRLEARGEYGQPMNSGSTSRPGRCSSFAAFTPIPRPASCVPRSPRGPRSGRSGAGRRDRSMPREAECGNARRGPAFSRPFTRKNRPSGRLLRQAHAPREGHQQARGRRSVSAGRIHSMRTSLRVAARPSDSSPDEIDAWRDPPAPLIAGVPVEPMLPCHLILVGQSRHAAPANVVDGHSRPARRAARVREAREFGDFAGIRMHAHRPRERIAFTRHRRDAIPSEMDVVLKVASRGRDQSRVEPRLRRLDDQRQGVIEPHRGHARRRSEWSRRRSRDRPTPRAEAGRSSPRSPPAPGRRSRPAGIRSSQSGVRYRSWM